MSIFLRQAQNKLFSVNKDFATFSFHERGFTGIYILVGILLLTALLGGIYYFGIGKNIIPIPFKNSPKVCTQEAKQCPDGSFVGREGSNCEFKTCPASRSSPSSDETTNPDSIGANWKTYTNVDVGYTLKYPNEWYLNSESPNVEIATERKDQYLHGVGIPQTGNLWITISSVKQKEQDGESIIPTGPNTYTVSRVIFKQNQNKIIEINGEFYKDDPKADSFRILVDQIFSTFKFIDQDQTSCTSDNDCGVNICKCSSQRKELIRDKDKICTRYCPGIPKCIDNKCVLDSIRAEPGWL